MYQNWDSHNLMWFLSNCLLLGLLQLVQSLRIRCADEVCLHVKNSAIFVHQVLLVFAFDLD